MIKYAQNYNFDIYLILKLCLKNGLPERAHNLNLWTEACCPLLLRDERETEDCDSMSTVQQSANVCRKNWLPFPDHLHSEITQTP